MGVLAFDDLFSYMEVDMTPVVAMLMGRGLRGPLPGPLRNLTPEAGLSVPLITLGDRPAGPG